MVTILYPYRNRELGRIKRSLDSLANQKVLNFEVFFIDYGSDEDMALQVQELVTHYDFISYEYLFTSNQPWNKCKALNYAVKKTESDYCFIADVDIIFHPDFSILLEREKDLNTAVFFKVGFLSEEESIKNCDFESYKINFYSNEEATGMTLFPVRKLKEIRGFDAFFHFWGAEDTDVLNRLKNHGCKIEFYDENVLLLHQWHPNYRQSETTVLNKKIQLSGVVELNHQHLKYNLEKRIERVNLQGWGGVMNESDYEELSGLPTIKLSNEVSEIDHFLFVELYQKKECFISVEIKTHPFCRTFKHKIKKIFRKKVSEFYTLKEVNDLLLLHLVSYYHHLPYIYKISDNLESIEFKIKKD